MDMALRIVLIVLFALAASSAQAQTPSASDRALLSNLKAGHPRLITLDSDIERISRLAETNTLLADWIAELKEAGEKVNADPPVRHELVGPRLLSQSRAAMNRIYTTALLYRLTKDKSYARRAVQEMLTAAAFPDWNPSHFLDTAEMTHALAIGYDWLYSYLLPEERATIRKAIVELGLKPSIKVYNAKSGWHTSRHNWNQVCNGGMIIGALAVAEDEPELSAWIVGRALKSLPAAMKSYAPDGAWAEGPGYWNYATRYTVYLIAALESATGSDHRLLKFPGFRQTGLFPIYITSPIGLSFNFADGGAGPPRSPIQLWLGRKFGMPVMVGDVLARGGNADPFKIMWFDDHGETATEAKLPLDIWFKRINVVTMRSSWDDPNGLFVGFKAGDNKENHSHLELGTFVLDADGQRWALELGADNYNLPNYFGSKRWTYYRLRTEGQNTLLINGQNQDPKAEAKIISYSSSPEDVSAVADLSDAYAPTSSRVKRGVRLVGRKQVLIQDEIAAESPVEVVWGMHTQAKVKVNKPDSVELTLNGKKLSGLLLEPQGARFEVVSAKQPPPENENKGISKLKVVLPDKTTNATIRVLFTPEGSPAEVAPPARVALDDWPKR